MFLLPSVIKLALNSEIFPIEVTKRLQDVYDMFFTDASFSDIIQDYGNGAEKDFTSTQGRMVHYIESFRALCHNFFLGELTPNKFKTGGHSTWIDYVAKFGCLVFIYYFSLIQKMRKDYITIDTESKKVILAVSIFYIISGILNSFQIALFTMNVFIIIPYFDELLTDDTKLIIRRPM